jgi:hypothetical protein
MTPRYAIMALCLPSSQSSLDICWCSTDSSSACRSVSIALMAKGLAHTRLPQVSTMHCKCSIRYVWGADSEILAGAGNCGERTDVAMVGGVVLRRKWYRGASGGGGGGRIAVDCDETMGMRGRFMRWSGSEGVQVLTRMCRQL